MEVQVIGNVDKLSENQLPRKSLDRVLAQIGATTECFQNLEDTIRRLQALEAAGADVFFAPGLPDLAAVSMVC